MKKLFILVLALTALVTCPHSEAQTKPKDDGWKTVLDSRRELRDFPESQVSLEKGILQVRAGGGIPIPFKGDNGAIRARVHFLEGHRDIQIRVRKAEAGFYNLISYGNPNPATELILNMSQDGSGHRLGVAKFQDPIPVGGFVDVEVSAFGDHIQVLLNGKVAVDVHDSTYPKGGFALASARAWFSNIQVRTLTSDPAPPEAASVAKNVRPASAAPSDPRLAQLQAAYEAARQKEVTEPFQQSVKALDAKYLTALDRAMETATKAANLDSALAFRSEKQRVTEGKPLPPDDTADLKALRLTYRAALSQLDAQSEQRLKPLRDKYIKDLDAYQTELTRAGNLDGVLAVRTLKEHEMAGGR